MQEKAQSGGNVAERLAETSFSISADPHRGWKPSSSSPISFNVFWREARR